MSVVPVMEMGPAVTMSFGRRRSGADLSPKYPRRISGRVPGAEIPAHIAM